MAYDIFLSHSSEDGELVERTRSELAGLGYSVFLDSEALPQVRPEAVTKDTAQALRDAMRECGSLLYLISEKSAASRWMPWELGFFDGFCGRVFIYPADGNAARHARGREYLKIYPMVPLRGREEFLRKYVPKSSAPGVAPIANLLPHAVVPWPLPAMEAARAPLFDYAQQEATAMHGPRLLRESGQSLFDPLGGLRIAAEMTQAFWRLWGLMPAPRRPGEKEGRWRE